MPELLELLESYRAEEASLERLFGGEGLGIRQSAARSGVAYQRRLIEAAKLVSDIIQGRRPASVLREVMTTSDFPLLFGDVLDRQVLANYREWPSAWRQYARLGTVSDFRLVRRFAVTGSEGVLEQVKEQAEYPAGSLGEVKYEYQVKKYGRRLPFSWEAIINNDLDLLTDIPQRFGRAARRSEDKFATQLHVDASGPHASVYTSGNKNIVTGNPVLGIVGLQAAYSQLGGAVDTDGEPIVIDMVTLEVPPALEITARNILNATQLTLNPNLAAGTTIQALTADNWMKNRTNLVVNPYIPIVASSANGNTTWFLHATPGTDRPAFEMGFLRGRTDPELFIKEPNARRVGGGAVNPLDGDFDTDTVEYKVRHVFGGTVIDPKMTVGSNGSGS